MKTLLILVNCAFGFFLGYKIREYIDDCYMESRFRIYK